MKLRIFLDLDGVLADFHLGYLRLIDRANWMEPGNWPTPGMEMTDCLDVPWESVYDILKPGFFENLPMTDFVESMIRTVEDYDSKFHICTSPGPKGAHDTVIDEKLAWIRTYVGRHFDRIIFTHDKTALRGPGHVLIDDYEVWCREFAKESIHEQAPRFARFSWASIIFPRPWNSRHALSADPVSAVRMQLAYLASL